MASFNRVILVGNLTRDIELKRTSSDLAIADLGLAVNDRVKRGGEWVEEATFVNITLFGRTAEIAAEYLTKGSQVLIEGRLRFEQWENKEGEKRSRLSVVGDRMQMLGGRGGGGASRNDSYSGGQSTGSSGNPDDAYRAPATSTPQSETPSKDDIPF